MRYLTKRHVVKIPKDISLHYCTNHHVVIFTNSLSRKTFRLKTRVIVGKNENILKITREPLYKMSNNEKKRLKSVQTTQVALLKQILLDISLISCKKLKLVGVGFRVSVMEMVSFNLLHFKLGYSHAIYFKIPKSLTVFCLKSNKLFLIGNTTILLTQIAALIRAYKTPEPYKGKGILYASENITLKEGKKI